MNSVIRFLKSLFHAIGGFMKPGKVKRVYLRLQELREKRRLFSLTPEELAEMTKLQAEMTAEVERMDRRLAWRERHQESTP